MGNIKSCCTYGLPSSSSSRKIDNKSGKKSRGKRGRTNGQYSGSIQGRGGNNLREYGEDYSAVTSGISSHPGQGGLYVSGGHPGSNSGYPVCHEESIGNLQHISEREPDDWEEDPALHPTTEALFMEKSKQSIQNGLVRKRGQLQIAPSSSLGVFRTFKKI